MIRYLWLGVIAFLFAGCPQFPVDPYIYPPAVSMVMQGNNGQKYLMYRENVNAYNNKPYILKVYEWDMVNKQWVKKVRVLDPMDGSLGGQFYLDKLNATPKYAYLYQESYDKRLFTINLATSQVVQRQFANNYSIISADEFVVYNGSNVRLHQLSTDVISNLHVLPTISAINIGLGLNIDPTKFQMLCTPEQAYQWDYKTHFCIVGNVVGYSNSNITALPNLNYFYEVNITVNANGSYAYKLLNQGSYDAHGGAYPMIRERPYSPPPPLGVYASVVHLEPSTQRTDTFTIDKQGNLHLFYRLKDDSNTYYEYYTQNNPTTPLYTQVLP